VLCTGTATVMFGALLSRVADPYSLMAGFHLVYMTLLIRSAICGILGISAGLALMGRGSNGRSVVTPASWVSFPDLPLGVIVGSSTLFCFSQSTSQQAEKS